ncbi:MAG: hypothetical protein HFI82_10755 [Eubacterium sp.]|jgi:hypothetical protein|nr:hypothetical protein [Eubacterium sp.]
MLRDEKYGTSLSDVGLSLPSSIANSSERRSYDEEILKSIIESDDVNRIMKQLTPHIQETNHSLERQVTAIEQIAFEAKKMSQNAIDNAKNAHKQSIISTVIAIISVIVTIFSTIIPILLKLFE